VVATEAFDSGDGPAMTEEHDPGSVDHSEMSDESMPRCLEDSTMANTDYCCHLCLRTLELRRSKAEGCGHELLNSLS
jgi:hypothetical protein